ncbi:amino acid permease [Pseudobacter ginsenosidimutans]|jgi:amino acid transporter|uniref:Amino acid/polyamine/organocation transporter (APC superfamily) n=1 Tax=Pseudobacter ginsenosidimutans TaxID=661488 RepID=A0A4Q7N2M5_9BACT|nr:amino acid permease [Pseudobacter ginsenosidimutans]QEC43754.1 amino acid permease [Pseudobacter ginsenosidimutans]RZS75169.1 amino acid/polyamine/organocation transporter (APC superfamily) [Pseudobacter ginsenosidimutans]
MAGSLFRKKSIDKILKDAQSSTEENGQHGLKKILSVKDLTFLGIAAVVGAGVFSTIGTAAADGGPGISLLFVITAVTCGFSALCYAEFASRVPISGSAYTYAYVTFGELIAWIIGWALILEYAIGNIVVAISWSSYFNNLLMDIGIHLPGWLTVDPATAEKAFREVSALQATGVTLDRGQQYVLDAYNTAPILFGGKFFVNIPAFVIVGLITCLTYVGIRESKRSANLMVIFKIAVVLFVIILGAFYVKPGHWSPFMPNGFEGVLKGVSAVFYAYIGFDAISTTAEEAKNPQRDLPRGMIYSLVICTVLYILIALVLTGMVPFDQLRVNDPLAFVFEKVGAEWISKIVSISAVVATTSVLLVFQLGQPRIWMSMSRDGLLPKAFGKVHKKYHTPYFSTIVTGILVAIPSLFMQSSRMTDLTSIGTLFAFVLVSGGVLLLPKIDEGFDTRPKGGFRLPYVNGQFIVPVLVAVFIFLFRTRIVHAAENLGSDSLQEILFLAFVLVAVVMGILTFIKKYSLIPVLGVLFCSYLLIEIPAISWIWFFVWMSVGLIIYFLYGYRNSNLAKY